MAADRDPRDCQVITRKRIAAPATALVNASVLALALATPGSAQPKFCGDVKRSQPRRLAESPRPPLAIGDSVMLNAVKPLAAAGLEVNTRGCRPFVEGVRLVRSRRRAGTLPDGIVLALGSNWIVPKREIDWALSEVGPDRTLWLVTPRETGGGSGADARVIRAAGREHADRVRVLDWVRFSHGRSGWFYGDGLHLTPAGTRAYVRLLRRASG